jgi:hypothetical protein
MQSDSPYRAPQAHLEQNIAPPGSPIIIKQHPASKGAEWFFAGFRRVFQEPFAWTGIGAINLLLLLLFLVVSLIPILGSFIPSLFYPVLVAGFMQAAANQDRGQLSVGDLFAGFSTQTGQLFLTGALYIAMIFGALVVILIAMVALGVSIGSLNSSLISERWIMLMLIGMLLFIGLMLPAIMAIWFAPALVILLKVEAIEALKLSFKACLRNFLPYLIYGLVALGVTILFILIVGGLFGVIAVSSNGGGAPTAGMIFMIMLVYLIMGLWGAPVVFCSIYQSYLDIFELEQDGSTHQEQRSNQSVDIITRR